jgi:hypothetical protein
MKTATDVIANVQRVLVLAVIASSFESSLGSWRPPVAP